LASLWDWAGERPASSPAMHAAALNFLNRRDSSVFFSIYGVAVKKNRPGGKLYFFLPVQVIFFNLGREIVAGRPHKWKGCIFVAAGIHKWKGCIFVAAMINKELKNVASCLSTWHVARILQPSWLSNRLAHEICSWFAM
jgi:hypothetical protein